jgi:NTE family protein
VSAPEVAFVLPAGGSTGAVQVGALRALAERGIRPDVVVGCSVGALNAAFFALDPSVDQARQLVRVWHMLGRRDVFGAGRARTLARIIRRHDHIYDPGPLQSLIRCLVPLDDLADAAIPVHVVTTDLDLGLARWWTKGPAHELLYASACLPGLFPPLIIDGRRHVDGGVLEPVPVKRAVDTDASVIYVLSENFGPGQDAPSRMGALDVLLRSFGVSRYARLPDPASLARSGQRVIVVPGAPTGGIDITDFSHTRRLISDSVTCAHRFLDGLERSSVRSQVAIDPSHGCGRAAELTGPTKRAGELLGTSIG